MKSNLPVEHSKFDLCAKCMKFDSHTKIDLYVALKSELSAAQKSLGCM